MFELLFKEPPAIWREAELSFASGWPGAALALAVAVAALAIVVSLWRAPLERARKVIVGLLQLVVAAVALTMLWRPALELERGRDGENAIAWLADVSGSMQRRDVAAVTGEGPTRREAIAAALNETSLLEDARFAPRLVAVGETPRALDAAATLETLPPAPLSGIGRALSAELADVGGTQLAAVVLLSDGADNVGDIDARWWQRLAAAGVPVHTVGVGRDVDDDDVELAGVTLAPRATVGAAVRARVRVLHGARESVRLRVSDGETLLLAEDIALDAGASETVRSVAFDAGAAGLKRLTFSVRGEAPDAEPGNDAQRRILEVGDTPRRVLYVEGEPRWEYKFLRRALHAHPGVEIVSLLRTSPNKFYRQGVRDAGELAEGFPGTREALFGYDAVIIGSLPAAELNADQQAALRDFVAVRGGSLLMLAGRRGLADGGWARSLVAAALPVVLDARLGADTYRRERARAVPTRQGLRTDWLRFAEDDADNVRTWTALPEVADHQRLGNPKPGARVLLERPGGEPLLAAQRYGRGSSLVLGTSGTWRWQMGLPSEDDSHERFWRTLLDELVVRALPRLEIRTDGPVLRDARATTVTVEALGADYAPLSEATLQARVTAPDGAERPLELIADPAHPGRYVAELALDADGPWGVAVTTPPDGESPAVPPAAASAWLLRESGSAEVFGARLDRAFLERVAALSGGTYRSLADIDALPAALATDNAALTRIERLPLWNMPLFFVLLVLAKGGEWLLRLRWKRL